MNDLNYVLLSGNLTKDPKYNQMGPDAVLCTFTIAVNRTYSDKKPSERKAEDWKTKTAFVSIETWGNVAESCAKHLSKGRGVRVVGRLRQTRWTDDGMPREKMSVVAEHVEFQPDRKKETTTVVDADEQAKLSSESQEDVETQAVPEEENFPSQAAGEKEETGKTPF